MEENLAFREAVHADIEQMMIIRFSVHENKLSNPQLVTAQDCEAFLFERGKGWVCEWEGKVVAFAIADLKEENIWALFVHPEHERKGIGKSLHQIMMDWYFDQGKNWVWLGTAPDTRAENFYRSQGWTQKGMHQNGELRFEMTDEEWRKFLDTA